ncbi:PepSY domain-containing protein [Pseudochelatococcus sp. B33]
MKRLALLAALAFAGIGAGAARADDGCRVPMARWQPREAAGRAAEALGWQVRRIRTDDGCYRIDAVDARGNRIEAQLQPDTLALRRIEVEFAPGGGLADLGAATAAVPP